VWLTRSDGVRLFFIWPAGFRVIFAPDLRIENQNGQIVARQGDLVELPQVRASSHRGTTDDPYPVLGILGAACYGQQSSS
jgi:hypothetical protein